MLLAAAALAILGSLLFLITPLITSRGLYQMEPSERLHHVQANPRPILIQNTLTSIGGLLTAIAYLLWSLAFYDQRAAFLHILAGICFLVGAVYLTAFFYKTYRDPASYHTADDIILSGNLYFILTSIAFIIYGILFIQTRIADWLGYLSIIVALLTISGLWRIGGKDLPPQGFYFVTLIAGVVFLLT